MTQNVCVVTGAGRGIGRAAAILLAGRGYRVAGVSRTLAQLQETAARAEGMVPFVADVSQAQAVRELVAGVERRFGQLHALVHCAGAAPVAAIAKTTDAQWAEVLAANVSSTFYLMREVWPILRRSGGGVIVNASSQATRNPFAGLGAYAAAKAGVNLLGLAGAREGAADGIRVHTIAPGAVETAMLRTVVSAEALPRDHCLEPEDVAQVIGQCVTGELRHMAGEVISMQRMT